MTTTQSPAYWPQGLIVSVYESDRLVFSGVTGPMSEDEGDALEARYVAAHPGARVEVVENEDGLAQTM